MKRIFAGALLGAVLAGPGLAAPADDMCRFVERLGDEGVPAAMTLLESFAVGWSAEQRAKLPVVVGAEMDRFEYRGGQVYRIGALSGVVEEFLLTLNLSSSGSVYARVLYEGNNDGELQFINFDFNSNYYEVVVPGFIQEPEAVDCN